MERISNKNPCLNCCSDRQIGNPDVWQSDCYRCEKLPNWKAKAINRFFDIEDILGDEYDLDRLKELVQADREGKCVVLPCKDWFETVFGEQEVFWGIDMDCADPIKEISVDSSARFTWYDGWKTTVLNGYDENRLDWEFSPDEIGKTVFLTREEAEVALEKMKKREK